MKIQIPEPGTVPEFVYDPEKPTQYTEQLSHYLLTKYKAMAKAKMMLDDGQVEPGSEEEYVVESLWNAQSSLIKQQQERFKKIGELLKKKEEALPSENALTDLINEFIELGAQAFTAWIIKKLAASALGAVAGGVIIPLTVAAIQTLRETYVNGETLLKGIVAMMDSLVGGGLEKTPENYEMRSKLIDQNEKQLANYLNEMVQIESSINGAGAANAASGSSAEALESINESLLLLARTESSVLCPHTGQYIFRKGIPKKCGE